MGNKKKTITVIVAINIMNKILVVFALGFVFR